MAIIPIPFGEGLQRSDGVMVVRPNTFSDLRNVYQFEGKAQARQGMTETDRLIDDVGVDLGITLALSPLRAENAAMGIGQDTVTDEIWANRLAIDGTNATNLGLYGTLAGTATWNPPIIILADTDGKCFIAHDEPSLSSRIVTKYYDPVAFPILQTLQADLDGNGAADVYFRGVVRHLSYIFGWGYGNATSPDRADVVRVSTAGDPTDFRDDAFFEVGQRQEPVMVCRPAGQFLMVFKETETYQIFGYSPDTFGIRPADTLFGCVSSRLAVSVAGTVFFWSVQGPRVTTGGQSVDIAVPLDIEGPDPASLAAEADVQNAFAAYDAKSRTVQFVWGQRVYALSIRNPDKPRWSYYELGETAQCGAQFFTTQSSAGGGGQPADGPEFNATAAPTINSTNMTLDWNNVGATGGEAVEIWRRESPSGAWSKAVEVSTDLSASQTAVVSGLSPITTYDFAIRYRRGGLFNPSATDPDPTTWPVAAQAQETTTVDLPVMVRRGTNNGTWQVASGPSESITIAWAIPTGHESLQIEVERRVFTEGDSTVQDVDGRGIGPPDSGTGTPSAWAAVGASPLAAGTTEFEDTALTAHRWHEYRLRFVGGTPFTVGMECWAGPDAPDDDLWSASGDSISNFVSVTWDNADEPTGRAECPGPTNAPANHQTNAWFNNMTTDPSSDNWTDGSMAALPYITNGSFTVSPTPGADNTPVRVGIRHKVTCHGTVYPSYWARDTTTPNYNQILAGVLE